MGKHPLAGVRKQTISLRNSLERRTTERDRLKAINVGLVEALGEAEEYFDQRADAEYLPGQAAPVGNEEMSLLTEIRAVLAKAKEPGDG